ncbi:MAG: hypothetical protein KJ886_05120 [Candidatus Thermoplasmatota archaeon]|nr:hypothetical protein [Candidatus Thermoplasmatota archaeon]MCG2827608.1 hypothetical protein [Thermoplasmatales archaeon]
MKNKILAFGICVLMLLVVFSSGCLEDLLGSQKEETKPHAEVQNWNVESKWSLSIGYYLDCSFEVINIGDDVASGLSVYVKAIDQNNIIEYEHTFNVGSLDVNQKETLSCIIDYEDEDNYVMVYITCNWDGGSSTFTRKIIV